MVLPLSIVVAVADNGVIGGDNKLLWRLKNDMRHFRELTMGKPLIMGRKTFQSIGKPLPGRITIVLTRDPDFHVEGQDSSLRTAATWDEACIVAEAAAKEMGADGIAVVGGAQIYALALPVAGCIHLTRVHASPQGDTFFPHFPSEEFSETYREGHPADGENEYPYTFIGLCRKSAR